MEGTYDKLDSEGKLILDLPIIEWKENMFYTAIFMINWFIEGGNISFENFENSTLAQDPLFIEEFVEALKELQSGARFQNACHHRP